MQTERMNYSTLVLHAAVMAISLYLTYNKQVQQQR